MKRLLPLLLIASLLLALSGCTFREDTPATPNATTESTLALPPAESVAPTVPTTTVPPTQATVPTEAAFTPYLVNISRADFPIHRGPGYDYDVARTIGAAGTFTIVEESVDANGNLWGKLKSGAGWVDLTIIEKEKNNKTPDTPTPPASSAGFGAVYADICRLLETGDPNLSYTYATVGMKEVVLQKDTKTDRYRSITYALEDVDNKGSREMVVLDAMGNSRILAIFALENGKPVMTDEGWYRARLYRLSDGTFYYEGSSGAAYSIFRADGQCWFTYPKDEGQMEIGYYYAADGSYDPVTAQEITAEEYNTKQREFSQKITAFSTYNFS